MNLHLYKTLWGHQGSLADAIRACVTQKWAGIEGPAPAEPAKQREFSAMLDDAGLEFIAEICTAGGYVPKRLASLSDHLKSLRCGAEAALECHARFLTVIGGCDAWTINQSVDFFQSAMSLSQSLGVAASFETHRSRSLFNPWITQAILMRLPAMELTCDFSHWCVVCERLVNSESEILALCAQRARHIHARVGYAQGPQVPHPAAPEHAEALAAHEQWWRQIWENQRARGMPACTMTPEFGPDGYLHTAPFTGVPVADLDQINAWMGARLRHQFSAFAAARMVEAVGGT
jgi:hypothetical protein